MVFIDHHREQLYKLWRIHYELDCRSRWNTNLHLVEFPSNNSYRASNKVTPFETLADQECQSPTCWTKIGVVNSPAQKLTCETTEKIIRIRNKIQVARNHRQSYADVRIRFDKRGKLNLRYIGLFKILAKDGTVAYRLELSKQLSRVHSTFHVSNLKKCLSDEMLAIPLDEIQIDDKLYFIEEPLEIMDREIKHLKQSHTLDCENALEFMKTS
ncbi:putative reverse transcriptase domain-containing protein [Tanacetum coccineum]